MRLKWGIYIFFFLIILQNLIKAVFHSQFLFVGYFWGVGLLVLVFLDYLVTARPLKIVWLDKVVVLYIIFQFIWVLPTFYSSPKAALLGFLYNVRIFIPYFLIRYILTMVEDARRLLKWMICLSFLVGLYGIYQYFFDWERLFPYVPGSAGLFFAYGRRAYSFLLTSGDTAFLSMGMALFLFGYLLGERKRRHILNLKGGTAIFIVLIVCLFLTFTRSAWLGFTFGISVELFWYFLKGAKPEKMMKIIIAGMITCLFILVILLSSASLTRFLQETLYLKEGSARVHYTNFLRAMDIFAQRPLLGLGLGRSGFVVVTWGVGEGFYSEGSLFQILVETGIIGMFVTLVLWGNLIWFLFKNYLKEKNERSFLFLGLLGVSVGIFISIPFYTTFLLTNIMCFYWGLVGISVFLSIKKEKIDKIF